MKTTLTLALVLFVAAAPLAFAHAGEEHHYMGTISIMHDDGSFMMKTPEGTTIHVVVASSTQLRHADDRPASASELKEGVRVVVKMSKDGRTARSVKMAAAKAH